MSDDMDDLELAALQRQLDDAFETTRPRRGYEDELWLKLQARRPFWSRLREALAGFGGAIREMPAVPAATVAIVLIVAIGIGAILVGGGLRPGGHSFSAAVGPQPADIGGMGRLPTPALHPGLVDAAVTGAAPFGPESVAPSGVPSNIYYGPATLTWAGTLPTSLVEAPVLTYAEPGKDQADQFAGSLGASTSKQVRAVAGFLGTYAGQGFVVSVRGTIAGLPREPFFVLTPASVSGTATGDPRDLATTFLARYSLVPTWPYEVSMVQSGDQARVVFKRQVQLADGLAATFVDWSGEGYGIEVDLRNGVPVLAFGQLPVTLGSNTYRLISNDAAVKAAVSSAPAGTSGLSPTPAVQLTSAQLVYALAVAGDQGYFEPAYLFSGSFQYNGQTYVKRVLVPLVDPSLRSS